MTSTINALRQRAETAEAQVAELTVRLRTDPLTGINNRLALQEAFTPSRVCAALMIDLNDFKHINDTYGHRAGDLVLVETAARLQRTAGAGELPARISGDEFVLWLGTDHPEALFERTRQRAREVADAIAAPMGFDPMRLRVSAAVGYGIASYPARLEDVLQVADHSMYRHKSRQGVPA